MKTSYSLIKMKFQKFNLTKSLMVNLHDSENFLSQPRETEYFHVYI